MPFYVTKLFKIYTPKPPLLNLASSTWWQRLFDNNSKNQPTNIHIRCPARHNYENLCSLDRVILLPDDWHS